ncbi:MAG TPA: TonB family protein [Methylomirabilota bacterium]|nr:TonB family protein [Methylomirabilota bacterium]
MTRAPRAWLLVVTLGLGACASGAPPREPSLDISAVAHPYFETVRKQIRSYWEYPCLKNATTGRCEYRDAHVTLDIGILRTGALGYVDVVQSSGYDVYDAGAVQAVRRAAPFPPVPDDVMTRVPAGSAAVAVRAQFNDVIK